MYKENKDKLTLDMLKAKLQKMLESNDGVVTEEIIEISQLLDRFILEEMENNNYNYNKK